MADNNVIDELQLKVKGDANSAIANLSKLQTQLRNTAKSIGSVQAAVRSLNGVDMTFKRLGNINVGGLSAAITQLERLSKVKLDHLTGKKLDLNVSITGASEATRQIEAMKKAANSINPKEFSDKIIKAFNIQDIGAKKAIREQYRGMMEELRNTGKFDTGASDKIFETVVQHGEMTRVRLNGQIDNMESRYKEFLKVISGKQFFNSGDFGSAFGETKGEINETLFSTGLRNIFTSQKSSAKELDGLWEELIDDVHGYGDVLRAALGSDYFDAMGVGLGNTAEQADYLAKTIINVRNALKTVSLSDVSKQESLSAYTPIFENQDAIEKKFKQNYQRSMSESVGKIPLDIVLDENSVTAQIQKMIHNASQKQYDFPIKVKVERSDLRQQFTDIIKGLDVGGLGDISEKLRATSVAIKEMSSVDVKSGGVSTFVNSIRKLADVDLSKFDITPITQIQGVVSEVANMGKLESGVVRLVSALARLANAGQKTTAASSALPVLGTNLHKVATGLASAGAIPSELNAFVSAISQLANAGNRTIDTAVNLKALGDAIRALITDLNGAPQANESLIRMTEALGQIASAGGRAGSAAKSIGKSIQGMADERTSKAVSRLTAVKNALKSLVEICQKAGGYVVRGVQKIVTSFKQLRSAGNGLQGATSSIKNMIGAMIGFRGITGLGSIIKQTIELGADLTEIDHIIESVFGDKVGVVDTWAKNAIKQFGIAEHSAKRYAGTLSSMFQASQIGYMDAGKMSMDLVGLAGKQVAA